MYLDPHFVYSATASSCALIAAVFDVKSRRVPNLLSGPALIIAFGLHLSLDGWHGLFNAIGAALICGIIFFIFYLAGGMGAGDVKLIAAAGGFMGLSAVPSLLVFTSLTGGLMAVALIYWRGRLRETLTNVTEILSHHMQQGLTPHPEIHVRSSYQLRLPYAVAIACGCLLTACVDWTRGVVQ
jgi:prepilin peptidase CpaA